MTRRNRVRTKVVAEITLAHIISFASESGSQLDQSDAMTLLNHADLAQGMWTHMMRAAEEYTQAALASVPGLRGGKRVSSREWSSASVGRGYVTAANVMPGVGLGSSITVSELCPCDGAGPSLHA